MFYINVLDKVMMFLLYLMLLFSWCKLVNLCGALVGLQVCEFISQL